MIDYQIHSKYFHEKLVKQLYINKKILQNNEISHLKELIFQCLILMNLLLCHSSCQSCQGPLDSDCFACQNQTYYELIKTPQKNYGICQINYLLPYQKSCPSECQYCICQQLECCLSLQIIVQANAIQNPNLFQISLKLNKSVIQLNQLNLLQNVFKVIASDFLKFINFELSLNSSAQNFDFQIQQAISEVLNIQIEYFSEINKNQCLKIIAKKNKTEQEIYANQYEALAIVLPISFIYEKYGQNSSISEISIKLEFTDQCSNLQCYDQMREMCIDLQTNSDSNKIQASLESTVFPNKFLLKFENIIKNQLDSTKLNYLSKISISDLNENAYSYNLFNLSISKYELTLNYKETITKSLILTIEFTQPKVSQVCLPVFSPNQLSIQLQNMKKYSDAEEEQVNAQINTQVLAGQVLSSIAVATAILPGGQAFRSVQSLQTNLLLSFINISLPLNLILLMQEGDSNLFEVKKITFNSDEKFKANLKGKFKEKEIDPLV